jgi:hypothetical protein
MRARAAASLAFLSLAAGLAGAQHVPIKRTTTDFDAQITFSAPTIKSRSEEPALDRDNLLVNVQVNKNKASGQVKWRLVLQALYYASAWRHYTGVSLVGGAQLPGAREAGHVFSCETYQCHYGEVVVVELTPELVRRAYEEGLNTRWNAKVLGTFQLNIPANHFTALQAAIQQPEGGERASSLNAGTSGAGTPTRSSFRPAACDWPGTKQGVGAC